MTIPQSYAVWDSQLTGRCKNARKVANNTWLIRGEDGSIGLKLHQTTIVSAAQDGRVTLNSGGWRTPTTKGRINDALHELGFHTSISQKDGVWLVFPSWGDKDTAVTFADGMWVLPDGSVAGAGPDIGVLKQGVKLIREYMRPVPSMLLAGTFPKPSVGDPWNFAMVDKEGTLAGFGGNEGDTRKWLVKYMKDKYYFGSLLLRAFERKMGVKHGDMETLRGMISGGIPRTEWRGFISVSPVCMHAFANFMNGEKAPMDIAARQLSDSLKDYLKFWFNLSK